MTFVYPRSHWDVVKAIHDALSAIPWILDPSSNGLSSLATGQLQGQPEATPECSNNRYPRLEFYFERALPEWTVENRIKEIVDVLVAEAPYIEALPAQLVDGETLIVERGFDNAGTYDVQDLNATFNTADFSDIANPTAIEIASVLNALSGVSASDVSGKVRVLHDNTGAKNSLKVKSGTATKLIANFPDYTVFGRNIGKEEQDKGPARYFRYPFRLSLISNNTQSYFTLATKIETLFRTRNMGKERAMKIGGQLFEVRPTLDPLETPDLNTGLNVTQFFFEVLKVPVLWTSEDFDGDQYRGGNWQGEGSAFQNPIITSFDLNLTNT